MQMPEIRMAAVRFLPEGCANLAGGGGVVSQPGAVPENAPEFSLLLGRSGQLCQPRMGCSGKSCGAEGPIPVEERT